MGIVLLSLTIVVVHTGWLALKIPLLTILVLISLRALVAVWNLFLSRPGERLEGVPLRLPLWQLGLITTTCVLTLVLPGRVA